MSVCIEKKFKSWPTGLCRCTVTVVQYVVTKGPGLFTYAQRQLWAMSYFRWFRCQFLIVEKST